MNTLSDWLTNFLRARSLTNPDGRMLYAYRLTNEEYDSLKINLNLKLARQDFKQLAQYDLSFCAGFVLLASEWWHREYVGGHWRWDPIISLICEPSEVDTQSRSVCVKWGFTFWKHEPVDTGFKFLGMVVAHGGLPLRALEQGTGNLSRILHESLRLTSRYSWEAEQLEEAISDRAINLPQNLRKKDIYRLLVKMVFTALELRREYSLTEIKDPITFLNNHEQDWMQRFPISLNESTAEQLLTDLLEEAARQKSIPTTTIFSVQRRLIQLNDGKFELQAVVSAPRNSPAEHLAGALRLLSVEQIPNYFSIELQGEVESWLQGRLLAGEPKSVLLNGLAKTLRGQRALDELTITARQRETSISDGPCPLPGGDSVPLDQPWVFAEREGAWALASIGESRLPEQTFRLALPPGWYASSESKMALLGEVRVDGAPDMKLFIASGRVSLEKGSERLHIDGGQSTELTENFIWEGKRLPWQPKRYPAFRGLPKIRLIAEDGSQSSLQGASITWKAAGSGATLANHSVHGLVDAIVMKGGKTLTRKRMLIVEDTARIEFKSGQEFNQGTLIFKGFGNLSPAIIARDIIGSNEKSSGAVSLGMSAVDIPPESVEIALTHGTQEIVFTLPFPSSGGRFFDQNGRVIQSSDLISLRDLVGCRLRIFDQNPDSVNRYSLILALSCPGETLAGLSERVPLVLPPNGATEIRLIDIKNSIESLLSFSDRLDAKVNLALKIGSQLVSDIEVSRYEAYLENSEHDQLSLVTARSNPIDSSLLNSIRLSAAPLTHMDNEKIDLDPVHEEKSSGIRWSTSNLSVDQGPWLIFSSKESPILVRPMIWRPQGTKSHITEGSKLAIAMTHQNSNERLEAINDALKDAVHNFGDSSWNHLDYLVKTFSDLPLSALDVFRALALNSTNAVAFALRTENDVASLCSRMSSELGFIWELTSPDDWISGVNQLRAHYAHRDSENELRDIFPFLLKQRCEKLAYELPSINLLLEIAAVSGGCAALSDNYKSLVIDGQRHANLACDELWGSEFCLLQSVLLRGHDEHWWPEEHSLVNVFTVLKDQLPDTTQKKIEARRSLFWTKSRDFKLTVVNLPIICALWTTTGTSTEWWQDKTRMQSLRNIRAFDPQWFTRAYQAGLRACLGFGFHRSLFNQKLQLAPLATAHRPRPATQAQLAASQKQQPAARAQLAAAQGPRPARPQYILRRKRDE